MNTRRVNRLGGQVPDQPGQLDFLQRWQEDLRTSSQDQQIASSEDGPLDDEEQQLIDEDPLADEEEEDLEEEPAPVVVPRKRGRPAKATGALSVPAVAAAPSAPKVVDIVYNLTIWTSAELAKAKAKRQPQSRILDGKSDAEFVDVKESFKIEIVQVLFPGMAVVPNDAYTLFYSIRAKVPNEVPLSSAEDYARMMRFLVDMNKPNAKIIAYEKEKENIAPPQTPVATQRANDAPAPARGEPPAKKAKTKAQAASELLPGNVAINRNIVSLRARWQCNKANCPSEYCYISPDADKCIPLTHEHQEKWGAAMERNPANWEETGQQPFATLEHPPNHALFSGANASTTRSALLQARLDAKAKERTTARSEPAAPAQSIVNVVLPNDIFGLHNPALQPLLQAGPAAGPIAAPPAVDEDALIPSNMKPGPKLALDAFCRQYDLPQAVLDRFSAHGFRYTTGFRFTKISELRAMEFKSGEVVEIRDAVEQWAEKD